MNWRDFIERVGWTVIQASGAATAVVLSTNVDWQEGLKFVGIAALGAAAKVAAAQQFGTRGSGDAIPGGVQS